MKMSVTEIKKMTPKERLDAMESLWSVMCSDESESNSPDWHGAILKDRLEALKSGNASFITVEEARKRIEQ